MAAMNAALHRIKPLALSLGLTELFGIALAVSLAIHLLLMAFHFKLPPVNPANFASPPLEVVLVNTSWATSRRRSRTWR